MAGERHGGTGALVGSEMDRYLPEYPQPPHASNVLLSESPFVDIDGNPALANSSLYRAPGGAWVFAAGTISWSWGPDDFERHWPTGGSSRPRSTS